MNDEIMLEKEYQKEIAEEEKDQQEFELFMKQQDLNYKLNVENELDKFCAKVDKIHKKYDKKIAAIEKKYNIKK